MKNAIITIMGILLSILSVIVIFLCSEVTHSEEHLCADFSIEKILGTDDYMIYEVDRLCNVVIIKGFSDELEADFSVRVFDSGEYDLVKNEYTKSENNSIHIEDVVTGDDYAIYEVGKMVDDEFIVDFVVKTYNSGWCELLWVNATAQNVIEW